MGLKAWVYKLVWTTFFTSFLLYGIITHNLNLRKDFVGKKYNISKTESTKLPAITLCSNSKLSERNVDKVLEIEKWKQYATSDASFRNDFHAALRALIMFDTKPHYVNNLTSGVIKILDDHKDELPEIIKQVKSYSQIEIKS